MKIAVIQFPGVNCEQESVLACQKVGMEAEIYRWNCKKPLGEYDGFLIPGGWAYEDRVRAGAIAAKDPLMNELKEQSKLGKPIIGICNGAQVLIESGLIPNTGGDMSVEFALAPNKNPVVSGYYCTWINLVNTRTGKSAFSGKLKYEQVIKVPIAHGEGRFVTKNKEVLEKLEKNNQIIFKYCTPEGTVSDEFPYNPNGSAESIAALCNPEGNVMSIMPHPERATENRQTPGFSGSYDEARDFADGALIFESIKAYIEGMRK